MINKTTEKIFTLKPPLSDILKGIQDREAKPHYISLLHWFYRLIEQEGIEIPSDVFSESDYKKAQDILANIDKIIEELKIENDSKSEAFTTIQEEIKKSNRLLYLGKEKWLELTFGSIIKVALGKGVLPYVTTMFIKLGEGILRLLN